MGVKNILKDTKIVWRIWLHLPTFVRNSVRFFTSETLTGELPVNEPPKPKPAIEKAKSKSLVFKVAGESDAGKTDLEQADNVPVLLENLRLSRFILHLSEGAETLQHHFEVWYEFCQSVDENVLVVTRRRPLFDRIANEWPGVNVVHAGSGLEAEWIVDHTPRVKAVLYVSNTQQNGQFVRFNDLKHIFLGHGDSEKAGSCGKHFRLYDEVWTAGRAHIDRFRNADFDFSSIKFRIVGRPTARPLAESAGRTRFDTFLYLPTWEGYQLEQNYTSVPLVESAISDITSITGLEGVAKLHPSMGRRDKSLATIEDRLWRPEFPTADSSSNGDPETGRQYGGAANMETPYSSREKEMNSADGEPAQPDICIVDRAESALPLMVDAAFLVADISSVVSDFLVAGRPIFLYVPEGTGISTSSSSVSMDSYCYIYSEPEELVRLVRRVIVDGNDYLRESRLAARQYFVDVERTLNHQFEAELVKMIPAAETYARGDMGIGDARAKKETQEQPVVVAHRGVTRRFPENSLGAFRDAVQLAGLDAVEFDVHLAADGALPIMHDPELGRTTEAEGAIGNVSLRHLRQLRLREPNSTTGQYSDEPVPTLEEALEILAPSDMELHIELKNDALGSPYEGLPSSVLALVKKFGLMDRCILTSFSPTVLQEIRYLDANVRLLASVNMHVVQTLGGIGATLRRIESIDGCIIAFESRVLRAMRNHSGQDYSLSQYGIWLVNEEDELREAINTGYRQITTDRPETAIQIRNETLECNTIRETTPSV